MQVHALKRFLSDRRGMAATELALLSPILLLLCLGLLDGWSLASAGLNLRAAVNSAAVMATKGITDETRLAEVAMSSWSDRPADAAISIAKDCVCEPVPQSCSLTCAGSVPPSVYLRIEGSGSWTAPFETSVLPLSRALVHEQVVRIQ